MVLRNSYGSESRVSSLEPDRNRDRMPGFPVDHTDLDLAVTVETFFQRYLAMLRILLYRRGVNAVTKVKTGLSGNHRRLPIHQLRLIDKSLYCGINRVDEELVAAKNLDILNLAVHPDCNAQVDRASFPCEVWR